MTNFLNLDKNISQPIDKNFLKNGYGYYKEVKLKKTVIPLKKSLHYSLRNTYVVRFNLSTGNDYNEYKNFVNAREFFINLELK